MVWLNKLTGTIFPFGADFEGGGPQLGRSEDDPWELISEEDLQKRINELNNVPN